MKLPGLLCIRGCEGFNTVLVVIRVPTMTLSDIYGDIMALSLPEL